MNATMADENAIAKASAVIEIYEGPEVFLRTLANVEKSVGLLYAAHFAQSEICNGGFWQLFSNSTGVLCPESMRGFEAIGMWQTSALVQEAAAILGDPYPRDRRIRQEKLKTIDRKTLNTFSQRFFALIASENGGFDAASKTSA
jgi:hypothetical protein